MRLDLEDIRKRLVEGRFTSEAVFAPIHVTVDDTASRPVVQLTQDPSLPAAQEAAEPRSLIRKGAMHLRGLLHYQMGQKR